MEPLLNKSKVFITVFLTTMIIGSPFAIKQIFAKQDIKPIDVIELEPTAEPEKVAPVSDDTKKGEKKKKEKVLKFTTVDDSYFNDVLFIGDSRTVGIYEYGGLEGRATFFASTGMNIYEIYEQKIEVNNKKVNIEELLSSNKYAKIYVMMGINELGYDMDQTEKKFKEFINYLIKKQPEAIIYIQANLHVTAKKSNSDKTFNNTRINLYNSKIKKLVNNKTIFYLDINEYFDDKNGNLKSEYSHDNIHIYAKYYKEWTNWLKKHAIKI